VPSRRDARSSRQAARQRQGTPFLSHLGLLGIRSLIGCGENTMRASTVDAYSHGSGVYVEECTFRSELIHKVNLFNLHHKYVDVMHLDEVKAHLGG
jgi:hypothetical protein